MTLIRLFTFAAATCLLSLTRAEALAQTAAGSSPVPVVVLMPQHAGQTDIIITRHAKDGYRIVVPRAVATAENLGAAIRKVYELVDRDGDTWRDDQVFRVHARQSATLGSAGSQRLLRELMKAAGGDSHGGRHTASVTIYVPGARSRAANRSTGPSGQ